jgi:DNA primase
MALFPQPFIDDLRLQANIVQVVQEYVPLRRAGATHKGLCPFHSEKTPSFHVNPDKGFFHCFGCGAGGDVFKFLELHEKVGFQDAVRMLAQKFGVALPEPSEGNGDDGRRDAALREELLKVHEVAGAYFREQLAGAAGSRARQQLTERGVSAATIDQLALGYAPPSRDALKSRLLKQGFSQGLLIQSGLIVQRENGEVVDRFRNRLMVPICRDTGSVIAFGGRSMDADQVPKYLNSPETAIYSKGRTLYGLNLTKASIRKFGYVVLVEGYFDFAQVFQSQAAPVVASCGTALTSQQAQLLRRFGSKIVLSFDPDAAGQGAVARSCELLVKEGFDVNVIILDKGEDPDTFIRRKGRDQYRAKLRTSRPYLEYLREKAAEGLDFRDPDTQRKFLADMLAVATWLPDAATRDQFADQIAHQARITEEVVRAEVRKAAVGRRTKLTERELPGLGHIKDAERALLWWLINRPAESFSELDLLDSEDLERVSTRPILELARGVQSDRPELLPSTLIQRLSSTEAELVTRIASETSAPALLVGDCVRALKRIRWEREHSAVQNEISRLQQTQQDGEKMNLLLMQMHELAHRIEELR